MKQITNRLFYNKWPYKIRCKIEGARVIKSLGVGPNGIKWYKLTGLHTRYNKQKLDIFYNVSKEFFSNPEVKTRVEYHSVDFYFLDAKSYEEAEKKLLNYVTYTWEPSNNEELKLLLDNKKIILCNKLPHDKYRYKIYFKEMKPSTRQNLISWAEKYNNNEIFITNATKIHFNNIKYKYCDHYFYAQDNKILFMLEIAASGFIRKIEEFVLRNGINTENNQ